MVAHDLSGAARWFTHDRPGLGESEPTNDRRTAREMVTELREALTAAKVDSPFVLVGHSFASLVAQSFAARHRDEVAGMVLVDGAHADQMSRFPAELNAAAMPAAYARQLRTLASAAKRGEPIPELLVPPAGFDEREAEAYRAATRPTPSRLEAVAAEYDGLAESGRQVAREVAAGFGDLPLIVLRHGIPATAPGASADVNLRYEEVWQQLQDELAARSTRGRVVVAEGAGHTIHHDRPDLVVEAIRQVVRGG